MFKKKRNTCLVSIDIGSSGLVVVVFDQSSTETGDCTKKKAFAYRPGKEMVFAKSR